MNYPAAELRGIKMNFYLINPDAEHRGILLIKRKFYWNINRGKAIEKAGVLEQKGSQDWLI